MKSNQPTEVYMYLHMYFMHTQNNILIGKQLFY